MSDEGEHHPAEIAREQELRPANQPEADMSGELETPVVSMPEEGEVGKLFAVIGDLDPANNTELRVHLEQLANKYNEVAGRWFHVGKWVLTELARAGAARLRAMAGPRYAGQTTQGATVHDYISPSDGGGGPSGQEEPASPRIFVSHSPSDAAFARELTAVLRACGANVWLAEDGLHHGDSFVSVVERELRTREILLVLLSRESAASRAVWRDVDLVVEASSREPGRRIVPVMIEEGVIAPTFSNWQTLDVSHESRASGIDRVLSALGLSRVQDVAADKNQRPKTPSGNSESTTSAPLHEPMPGGDQGNDFQVTAFHAKEAQVDTWDNLLLVYAHIASALAAVRQDALEFKEQLGDRIKVTTLPAQCAIPRGTELTLRPKLEGVQFEPSAVSFMWTEDWHRATFKFKPDKRLADTAATGYVEVYAATEAGVLLISRVKLPILFEEGADAPLAHDARMYPGAESAGYLFKSVFASYAHEDEGIVRDCSRAYRALGISMHVDYLSLLAGERFEPALKHLIDASDIFQLYWSRNAACSAWVRKEWEHALASNPREGFIRPLYWEEPMPPVPDELAHIHFARLEGSRAAAPVNHQSDA